MILLPVIAITLNIFGYKRTKTFIARFIYQESNTKVLTETDMQTAQTIARITSVAARHGLYHANCLEQSLVLWWLLGQHHFVSEIKFGMKNNIADEFGAHSWVECNSVNISDSEDEQQHISVFDNKQPSTPEIDVK